MKYEYSACIAVNKIYLIGVSGYHSQSRQERYSQDKARPHDGFTLFEFDLVAIKTGSGSNEHARPAEGQPHVGMCVYLLEQVRPGEELGGGTRRSDYSVGKTG